MGYRLNRKLVGEAEKAGVVLGLENHWGLGLTPEGVLRIVDAIDSPWLKVTLDTGIFLKIHMKGCQNFQQRQSYFSGKNLLRRWKVVHP